MRFFFIKNYLETTKITVKYYIYNKMCYTGDLYGTSLHISQKIQS